MNLLTQTNQRILDLEKQIEELIEHKDEMILEVYSEKYRYLIEDLFYAKNYKDFINKQVISQRKDKLKKINDSTNE